MTKTWCIVLAALLGLTTATLHAAPPPEFLSLPPTEIKPQPLPLETKTPSPAPTPLPLDAKAPLPAPAPHNEGSAPACSACPKPAACAPCGSCGLCGGHLQRMLACGHHDHATLEKLRAWLLFRPCQCTPLECCFYVRPVPDNYLYFMYLGCQEHDCGGCCKGKAACGCNTCAKPVTNEPVTNDP